MSTFYIHKIFFVIKKIENITTMHIFEVMSDKFNLHEIRNLLTGYSKKIKVKQLQQICEH